MSTPASQPLSLDDFRIVNRSGINSHAVAYRPRRRSDARRRLARLVDTPAVTSAALASVHLARYGLPGPDCTVVLLAGGFGVRTWSGGDALEQAMAEADAAVGIHGALPAPQLVEAVEMESVPAAA